MSKRGEGGGFAVLLAWFVLLSIQEDGINDCLPPGHMSYERGEAYGVTFVPRVLVCTARRVPKQHSAPYRVTWRGHARVHVFPLDFSLGEVWWNCSYADGVRGCQDAWGGGPRHEEAKEEPPLYSQGLEMGQSEIGQEQIFCQCNRWAERVHFSLRDFPTLSVDLHN